jgi:hypothetical protein
MQKILRLNSKWSSWHDQEVLLVLDGTTGLNMLPQAREFNQVKFVFKLHSWWWSWTFLDHKQSLSDGSDVEIFILFYHFSWTGWFVPLIQVIGVTGFVLTKLDGTSRGGCVVGIFSNYPCLSVYAFPEVQLKVASSRISWWPIFGLGCGKWAAQSLSWFWSY